MAVCPADYRPFVVLGCDMSVDLEQGSEEWLQARCGKVTASRFGDVMTQPRSKADREAGKLSGSAQTYLYDVVGEILTGKPKVTPETWAMKWGKDYEPHAREIYAARYNVEVQEVGFIQSEFNPMLGCSPDGLVGGYGVEIKCFQPGKHLEIAVTKELPKEVVCQIQGSMLVTGCQRWDFVGYCPELADVDIDFALNVITIHRDLKFCSDLRVRLTDFCNLVTETVEGFRK